VRSHVRIDGRNNWVRSVIRVSATAERECANQCEQKDDESHGV